MILSPNMAEQKQDNQHEPTYSSSVRIMGRSPEDLPEAINDWEEWRERVWISVLAARHDDDDDEVVTQNLFSSLEPRHCDRGLIVDIVYFFQIWNQKELNIIIK